MKKSRLFDMTITEGSLCKKGANHHAKVMFWKSADYDEEDGVMYKYDDKGRIVDRANPEESVAMLIKSEMENGLSEYEAICKVYNEFPDLMKKWDAYSKQEIKKCSQQQAQISKAVGKIEEIAETIRKAEGCTAEIAFNKALTMYPHLYEEYLNE